MTAPTPAVFAADDCDACGPGAPGAILSDDPRYGYDLTPPPWEPCSLCAERLRVLREHLHFAQLVKEDPTGESLRRYLEQGQ